MVMTKRLLSIREAIPPGNSFEEPGEDDTVPF
jgi:hypothetical protein